VNATEERRPDAGLCDACRHQQLIRNTRGSVFSLCRLSRTDPDEFPRYPRLPVAQCAGYERRPPDLAPPATGAAAG
jgi:hypothetical protein